MWKLVCALAALLCHGLENVSLGCDSTQGAALLHDELSERELHHLFGVKQKQHVPEHWLGHPKVEYVGHADLHLLSLPIDGRLHHFELSEHHDLFSEGLHSVSFDSSSNTSSQHSVSYDSGQDWAKRHCVLRGRSVDDNSTTVALVGCGEEVRAMIAHPCGDYTLIHPVPARHTQYARHPKTGHRTHVLQKRSSDGAWRVAGDFALPMMKKECLFDARDDPLPYTEPEIGLSDDSERLAVARYSDLTIELALFADDAMWRHFLELYGSQAEVEMQRFLLTAVNNIDLLYQHTSIDPPISVKIVRYQVMKRAPVELLPARHSFGEVDLLLENFCDYQDDLNPRSDLDPRHWDHALLFSGHDLYRGTLKSVAGYAPVKGMCSNVRSCTINEGVDFGSVFVITHEMGHSLGMYHDGDNGCDSGCCIMSPSVGTGKTKWSSCSVNELNRFIRQLGRDLEPVNCLTDNGSRAGSGLRRAAIVNPLADFPPGGTSNSDLPGQRYNLDQQCRTFHGACWSHELRDGQRAADVCSMVWCGGGEGIIRTTHPALEGTHCGDNKWCIEGECRSLSRSQRPSPVSGQWSEWNDAPSSSCGGTKCSTCSIAGQLRLRRSLRLCDDPAPNNGGSDCAGSGVRGLLCSRSACAGLSPDQYATDVCGKLRRDANTPDLQLSGKGFQYDQSPCKVWCHMRVNSFIRTVGNFPDGTPCGDGKYCVKGECLTLSCSYRATVSTSSDCPSYSSSSSNRRAPVNRFTSSANADSKDPVGTSDNEWAQWSDWSECTQTCGAGIRRRVRRCLSTVCTGSSVDQSDCDETRCPQSAASSPAAGTWTQWTDWTQCDVTCGQGTTTRLRSLRRHCIVGKRLDIMGYLVALQLPDYEQFNVKTAYHSSKHKYHRPSNNNRQSNNQSNFTSGTSLDTTSDLGLGLPPGAVGSYNEATCGTVDPSHPGNIKISGGKIQGVSSGIVGGDVAPAHSWPWQVQVGFVSSCGTGCTETKLCGGTVISKDYVLTAAHCVDDKMQKDPSDKAWIEKMRTYVRVRLGTHKYDRNAVMWDYGTPGMNGVEKSCRASKLIIHPKWPGYRNIWSRKAMVEYDLALIKLDCPLEWNDVIKPICLPDDGDQFFDKSEKVVLTGWGKTGDNEGHSGDLRQLVADIAGKEGYQGDKVFLVAPDQNGACEGDSGGPANAMRGGKWVLAGVTSYQNKGSDGGLCNGKDATSGYTHVPTFMQWIKDNIN